MSDPLVILAIPTLSMGGAERIALELAARLPERGFRTRLVALFGAGPLADEARVRDIRWMQILDSAHGSRIELISRIRDMLQEFPERRPTIIHTHLFGADVYVPLARMLGGVSAKGVRVVSTAHNVDRESGIRHAIRGFAARNIDAIAAISEDVAAYAIRDLRVPSARIRVIPNGIETANIPARPDRSMHAVPRLVAVGRLEFQKGHETLFRALADVAPPWELDIAGEGSLERDLRELAERLGLASRIRFLGNRTDIGALLADADVFCFPSRWEGAGLSLIEAMSAGLPVIASDLPALREFVPPGRLVPAEDPRAWAEAIRATFADASHSLAFARALAPDIRLRFGIDRMVDAYAEWYEEVMKS